MNEGNSGTTTFSFTVSLSAPAPAGGVTFDIATADNTAMTADNDYVQKTLTSQTIPAGSSTYAFDVLVNGDTAIEPNESFFVNVTNVMNAVVTDGQGQGTITNDDFDTTAPVISYTPLSNINTAADRNLSVTATDAVGVTVMAITWIDPTFGVVMNPCSLSTGTAQSGVWNCTIVGASTTSPGAIAYRVTASDAAMNGTVNPSGGVNNLYTIGAATIPAGNYANMNPGDGVTLGGNVNVSGVLTLGGIVNTGTNILTLGCDTTVAGGGTSNYVIGNLAKDYCTTGTFTYPVGTALLINAQLGTASGYSPFTANVTALATVPSTLTVNVTDGFLTGTDAAQSASRFWNVTETGELTADISFTYLDEDIIGTETGYKVLRRSGTTAVYPGGTVNDVTNTATAPGVTNFSGWAAGNLAPTAANASVSGRVSTANGYGIRNVTVMITGGGLTAPRYIKTGTFGSYQFNDLPVGQTYVVSVLSKKYNFPTPSIVLNLQDNVGDADFVAEDR